DQVPGRELEVLARTGGQLLEVERREPGRLGLDAAPSVEDLEHGQASDLLGLEVVLGLRAGGDEAPPLLTLPRVHDVVLRAPLGIADDLIGLVEQPELALVPG